ncbi:MAG: NADH-quinone oxidoreductase subunit C [Thermodesulfovibrio sp.]|nr:NADH-quinone oxidoreductase subunit C [Thermodesulfovibrio sp.]
MAEKIKKAATEASLKIAEQLRRIFYDYIVDIKEFRGQVLVVVNKEKIKEIIKYLKEEQGFNHLQDLCGVDYYPQKPRFEVVYSLFSIWRRLYIRLKVKVDEEDPEIESISDLWQSANWLERECFDMFGLRFKGHPDLKRILMPEDWEGYPLRKDYPIEGKEVWKGFREIVESGV